MCTRATPHKTAAASSRMETGVAKMAPKATEKHSDTDEGGRMATYIGWSAPKMLCSRS